MYIDPSKPYQMPPPYPGKGPIISRKVIGSTGQVESNILLNGVIGDASNYTEVLCELYQASVGDKIRLILDGPGGNVYTTQLLIDAMLASKADVSARAAGCVASAYTMIWFYAPTKEVDDWADFMFHGTSHGTQNKSSLIKEEATIMVEYMNDMLKQMVASGVLTSEEYDRIVGKREDTHVSAEDMRKRLVAVIGSTEGFKVFNAEGDEVVVPLPEATPEAPATKEGEAGTNDEPDKVPGAPEQTPVPEKSAENPTEPATTPEVVEPNSKKKKCKGEGEEEGGDGDDDDENEEGGDDCPCDDPNEYEFEIDKINKGCK